jgi:hypothetical protein
MKTIETEATIAKTGEISLPLLESLPVGRFKVVLIIDESPIEQAETPETNPSENSFLAAAGSLIGCLDGLPPDLSHLSDSKPSQPASNLLKDVSDLIGSIDSRVEPHQTYQKTAFGEALALKLAKQGIQRQ